eukprot:TRINITY_DN1603_c0_g1_i3.p1 TRINITY_DN1603_c0_g1~~TRINITY_DN1603_c0_g1_i3.p1  ORF type:complete len:217 (+),score=34.02 TRINITY_DN1603_c0_g1_i3:80-652(+)
MSASGSTSAPSAAGTASAAAGASSSSGLAVFPAFRSEEWIKTEFDKIHAPAAVLDGVDISPQTMFTFPTVNMFPGKVAQVREQIKTALYRQVLFKVQNVEVTYMDECREDRILRNVAARSPNLLMSKFLDYGNPADVTAMQDEVWTVDRCGRHADYHVRYYKEGADGYSATVWPAGIKDMYRAFQYNYFS